MVISFSTAIKLFFKRYATFSGRATRAEYWWAILFCVIVNFVFLMLGGIGDIIRSLFNLAVVIPTLAVTTRRLHDINLSGWYLLAYYIICFLLAGWGVANIIDYIPANGDLTNFITDDNVFDIMKGMMWPVICSFIPNIALLVLMCRKSGPANKYGPAPFNGLV